MRVSRISWRSNLKSTLQHCPLGLHLLNCSSFLPAAQGSPVLMVVSIQEVNTKALLSAPLFLCPLVPADLFTKSEQLYANISKKHNDSLNPSGNSQLLAIPQPCHNSHIVHPFIFQSLSDPSFYAKEILILAITIDYSSSFPLPQPSTSISRQLSVTFLQCIIPIFPFPNCCQLSHTGHISCLCLQITS